MEAYTEHGNQTQAAIDAGYSPHTAQVQGSQLKKKLAADIDAMLTEKMSGDCAMARSVIVKLAMNANSEETRLKAAKDIMDRGGHPASKEIISKKDESKVSDKLDRLREVLGKEDADKIIEAEGYLPNPEGDEDAIRH